MTAHKSDDADCNRNTRPLPSAPTDIRPGPGKVETMRMRYEQGEHLHHPDDKKMDEEGDERPSLRSGHWGFGDGVDAPVGDSVVDFDFDGADF